MSLQMDYQRMNEVRSLDEVTFELETFNNNLKVICDNENEYLIEFFLFIRFKKLGFQPPLPYTPKRKNKSNIRNKKRKS